MFEKIKDFISSFDKSEEYDYEENLDYGLNAGIEDEEIEAEDREEKVSMFKPSARPKIVKREDINAIRMQIVKPTRLEEAEEIVYILREKQAAILNFEGLNKDVATRIIDIVSGGVFALDGHIEKVSNAIFIAAPRDYRIQSATNGRSKRNNNNFSFR